LSVEEESDVFAPKKKPPELAVIVEEEEEEEEEDNEECSVFDESSDGFAPKKKLPLAPEVVVELGTVFGTARGTRQTVQVETVSGCHSVQQAHFQPPFDLS